MISTSRYAVTSCIRSHRASIKNVIPLRFLSESKSISGEAKRDGPRSHQHFLAKSTPHPLGTKKAVNDSYENDEYLQGDHTGRQQNHIWTTEEIDTRLHTLYRHEPTVFRDRIVNKLMYGLYHTFNFITGYKPVNPTVKSIEWRLIVLESIAGVPGFVAAGFRHFKSLRTLQRDHGWIASLLEEAENERMHLLVCLKMFEASKMTRMLVITAQYVMTPVLMSMYLINPKSMHRFVGYLEETACHTYASVIKQIDVPGTHLHREWADLQAPAIAKGYWKLNDDAKWVEALRCMFADEANHRDVNHTFASMEGDDPNPYVLEHKENAYKAWRLDEKSKSVVVEKN